MMNAKNAGPVHVRLGLPALNSLEFATLVGESVWRLRRLAGGWDGGDTLSSETSDVLARDVLRYLGSPAFRTESVGVYWVSCWIAAALRGDWAACERLGYPVVGVDRSPWGLGLAGFAARFIRPTEGMGIGKYHQMI